MPIALPDGMTPATVAAAPSAYPETFTVYREYGCPEMRRGVLSLMCRILSIRAARVHRLRLDDLLHDVNAAAARQG